MTEPTKIHGNTKKAADMAIAKKQISRPSYDAVLAGTLALAEAKSLGRDRGPDTTQASGGQRTPTGRTGSDDRTMPDVPPQPVSRISKGDRSRHCIACGGLTKGGRFHPGCDAKMHRLAREYVLGERELTDEQLSYIESSGKLEQAKARVEREEAKRQEKITDKSERQRQREGAEAAKKRNASE